MSDISTGALSYRRAIPEDAASLAHLAQISWRRFESALDPYDWNGLHQALDKVNYHVLAETSYGIVCEGDKGQIVGMAFLIPRGNATEIFPAHWCYVRMVTVHPDYHGRNIGRELMQKSIEHARATGERTMGLHTSEIMPAARHIYESMGFNLVSELGHRYGKRYWLYRLDL